MKPNKILTVMKSTQAKAAKQIKSILKEQFPNIKFSVTSDSYAGGSSVRISYEDGVQASKIRPIVQAFQYGNFDGMRDIYEYDNVNDDLPQVKYVNVSRSWSDSLKSRLQSELIDAFGLPEDAGFRDRFDEIGGCELGQKMWREFTANDYEQI